VAQIEIYKTPDIHKKAVLRGSKNQEVEQDTVEAQETIREELDVDTQGRPIVDKKIPEGFSNNRLGNVLNFVVDTSEFLKQCRWSKTEALPVLLLCCKQRA